MVTALRRVLAPWTAVYSHNRASPLPTRKGLPARRLELERLENRLVLSGISDKYLALGGASGFLGKPTMAEQVCPDGVGHYEYFQGGAIYWSPSTAAHEVHGAILGEWGSLGWETSFLGYPTSDETATAQNGRYNSFQHGYILWSAATGAHEVHGAILNEYAAIGWQNSPLGFPTTDETGTPDGIGRYNHFQYGSIYWTPQTGAHEIHGAIRAEWASIGWERSVLGYPTSDETATNQNGRYNSFQHGYILWSAATGAHEVHGAILNEYAAIGWQDSALGFPVTDETGLPDGVGRFNHFQGGTIYWEPWMGTADLFLHDRAVAAVEQSAAPLGVLSRNGMLSVFGKVESEGTVSSTAFGDLEAIAATPSFVMPDYVRVLTDKVVYGNAANAHYRGAALGNLYVGSSASQLTKLVDKWFLGMDHPDSSTTTYRLASGGLFGSGGPTYFDVNQGDIADCYYLAPLGEVAYQHPDAINQMFIDNGDNTYTVRFFNSGVADYLSVDRYLPVNGSGYFLHDNWPFKYNDPNNILWVPLAEKAYAQLAEEGWSRGAAVNSYSSLNYGDCGAALSQITGLAHNWYYLSSSQVSSAYWSGDYVVLASNADSSKVASNVVANHCYALLYANDSSDTFILFNPWGTHQSSKPWWLDLSFSDLQASFDSDAIAGATLPQRSASPTISLPPPKSSSSLVADVAGNVSSANMSVSVPVMPIEQQSQPTDERAARIHRVDLITSSLQKERVDGAMAENPCGYHGA